VLQFTPEECSRSLQVDNVMFSHNGVHGPESKIVSSSSPEGGHPGNDALLDCRLVYY